MRSIPSSLAEGMREERGSPSNYKKNKKFKIVDQKQQHHQMKKEREESLKIFLSLFRFFFD